MPLPREMPAGDMKWRGIDQFANATDIAEGLATVTDNLYVEAGRLTLRPGFLAQWNTALGSPIYGLTPITQADASTQFWFACGTNLYRFVPGATAPVLLTLPAGVTGIVPIDCVICQSAGYVYVADASATGLLRFLPDGTGGEAARGLNTPPAPAAVIRGFDLGVPLTIGGWQSVAIPVTNYVATAYQNFPDYTGTISGNQTDGYWVYVGGATNVRDSANVTSPFNGQRAARMDSPMEYVETATAQVPASNTNAGNALGLGAVASRIFVVDAVFAIVDFFQDGEDFRCQATCYLNVDASDASPFKASVDLRVYPSNGGERKFVLDCRACPYPIAVVKFHLESPR